jgi:AcrR family transcriptional regulator
MEKRKYTQRRRAELQDGTRQRITEAAMALHEEIGPRNTTVSAIAERAGVQRLTVYRHFPDERAVIQACSALWTERNPPPPPPDPRGPGDDADWLQDALHALYAYNRRTQRMWTSIYRDADEIEALREALEEVAAYHKEYGAALLRRLRSRGEPHRDLRAVVGLALTFATWSTLAAQGLGDRAMARLMGEWIAGLAARKG